MEGIACIAVAHSFPYCMLMNHLTWLAFSGFVYAIISSWLTLVATVPGCQDCGDLPPVQAERHNKRDFIDGLTLVAPPKPFPSDPMVEVVGTGAEWIAVVPYGFTRRGEPAVHHDTSGWQWWGERPVGARKTIQLAHAAGVRVMLKPQVYVPGSWPGAIDFETEAEWEAWESAYRKFLQIYVDMAARLQVDMLCIGTEFKVSSRERPQFWRKLIRDIRSVYQGQLTYAANWDEYQSITFWEDLNYIGIDAYFPLMDAATPKVEDLKKAWQEPAAGMERWSKKWDKPILFTEFGYLSVDGCAYKNWELESKIKQLPINETAQANALEALLDYFSRQPYWEGGFLWKWFPHMQGHEGYPARDYTPQDKEAEAILRKWYTST